MKYRVVYTDEARNAIRANAKWWAENRSVDQAWRWYNKIYEAMESLGEMPSRHPLAREHAEFPFELRAMNFGVSSKPTHRVLYTIRPEMVEIIAVLHAHQDDFQP